MPTEYSAEWVKVPDGNGGTKKVWLRDSKARKTIADKFAVVEGTLAANNAYTSYVSYPTGFTVSNCVILSVTVKRDGYWRGGDGLGGGNTQTFAQLGDSGVRVYNNGATMYSQPWRVSLMRTDI